jgi:hypothetical protein
MLPCRAVPEGFSAVSILGRYLATPVPAQFISSPGKGKRVSTIFSPRNRNV